MAVSWQSWQLCVPLRAEANLEVNRIYPPQRHGPYILFAFSFPWAGFLLPFALISAGVLLLLVAICFWDSCEHAWQAHRHSTLRDSNTPFFGAVRKAISLFNTNTRRYFPHIERVSTPTGAQMICLASRHSEISLLVKRTRPQWLPQYPLRRNRHVRRKMSTMEELDFESRPSSLY